MKLGTARCDRQLCKKWWQVPTHTVLRRWQCWRLASAHEQERIRGQCCCASGLQYYEAKAFGDSTNGRLLYWDEDDGALNVMQLPQDKAKFLDAAEKFKVFDGERGHDVEP